MVVPAACRSAVACKWARAALSSTLQEFWTVTACIQQYDRERGYIAGTMCASDVPEAPAPVATFFEGEIIDNVNHSFYTADWDAVRLFACNACG